MAISNNLKALQEKYPWFCINEPIKSSDSESVCSGKTGVSAGSSVRHKTCKKTKDDEWNWNLSCRHYANEISTHPYGPYAYKYLCLFTWLDLNSTVQYILRYLTSRFSQLYEDPVPEILFNAMLLVERQDKDDWTNILEVMTCHFLNFDGGLVAAL